MNVYIFYQHLRNNENEKDLNLLVVKKVDEVTRTI